MPKLATTALVALIAALALSRTGMSALHVHLALAAGMLPLMVGAMLHFAPVLTRSGAARRSVAALPWLALLSGLTVVGAFAVPAWLIMGRNIAAGLALSAALAVLGWMTARSRAALSPAHPGLRWYQAALGCFALAMLSVLAMSLWPEHTLALKRFHLHLNTLGLIGLTAVGTLQVLLPTAVGEMDGQAATRLRRDLPLVLGGTLLIAGGAAWRTELAWLGMVLWLVPVVRMSAAWWRSYRPAVFSWHGAAPSLAGAAMGFLLILLLGPWHAGGGIVAADAAHGFIAAFLLPLVTGAVSQLLPLWLRPGVQDAWHTELRKALGRWSGLRAILLVGGGLALTLGNPAGWLAVAVGMALFVVQLPAIFTKK
ncbi:MAG: hypothetical protein KGZ83_17950 [Sulfuricella sp.]|nr:hypothetical protein [Sulfuricella sp.]